MKYLTLLMIILHLHSCMTNQNISGVYVKQNNQNLIDTIKVLDNGNYERFIYSKSKVLVYSNKSKWKLENNRITLYNFFKDEDEIFYEEENKTSNFSEYDKFLMTISLPYDGSRFYINADMNLYYMRINW